MARFVNINGSYINVDYIAMVTYHRKKDGKWYTTVTMKDGKTQATLDEECSMINKIKGCDTITQIIQLKNPLYILFGECNEICEVVKIHGYYEALYAAICADGEIRPVDDVNMDKPLCYEHCNDFLGVYSFGRAADIIKDVDEEKYEEFLRAYGGWYE